MMAQWDDGRAGVAPWTARSTVMATYLLLCNWTDQGIRNIKEAPERRRRATQLAEQLGCKIMAVFLTMGQYDLAIRVEAPDDEAIARLALSLGAQGNLRTTTLKAFPADDYERIIGSLS
jgi:uncharacterized protein with GYD domain